MEKRIGFAKESDKKAPLRALFWNLLDLESINLES